MAGSSPAGPTKAENREGTVERDCLFSFCQHLWGLSSAGRAPALHAGGQGFESPSLHHTRRLPFSLALRGCLPRFALALPAFAHRLRRCGWVPCVCHIGGRACKLVAALSHLIPLPASATHHRRSQHFRTIPRRDWDSRRPPLTGSSVLAGSRERYPGWRRGDPTHRSAPKRQSLRS